MTIQKKSLISTLNTTKKAIVASTPAVSTSEARSSARLASRAVSRAASRAVSRAASRAVSRSASRAVSRSAK